MRRPLALALAAAAVLGAGCSTSPCQELGEKVCNCSGLSSDACKTQVEGELKRIDPPQSTLDRCSALLGTCHEPIGAVFCEWLSTENGKISCGLAEPELVTSTAGGG